jgi:hypothetical protein
VLVSRINRSAAASIKFIGKLDPDRIHWVLGAQNANSMGWRWVTFHGPHREVLAERWIAMRYAEGVEVWLLLGDPAAPVQGPEIPASAVASSRFVAAASRSEEAFLTPAAGFPAVYRDAVGRFIAVWRLFDGPIDPVAAVYASGRAAAQCCTGRLAALPQLHYIPLPGDLLSTAMGGSMVRMPLHRAPLQFVEVSSGRGRELAPGVSPLIAQGPRFIRGDSLAFNNLKWLWPNLLLANAFSLVGGEAGVGKSTVRGDLGGRHHGRMLADGRGD